MRIESSEFTTSLPLQRLARERNLQDVLASEHDDMHKLYIPASEYGVMWGTRCWWMRSKMWSNYVVKLCGQICG